MKRTQNEKILQIKNETLVDKLAKNSSPPLSHRHPCRHPRLILKKDGYNPC